MTVTFQPTATGTVLLPPGKPLTRVVDALSPLRYPGSKRKLVPAIRRLVDERAPGTGLFVEPFAGGASVSLALLELDAVDRVMIGDADPYVAAFWSEACLNGPRLVDDMHRENVTVDRWDHWRAARPADDRARAMRCLFLNRTSFSGIIAERAGPIRGRAQTSAHTIDCRFNKDALERRILNVHELYLAGCIVVAGHRTWQETVQAGADLAGASALFYLDPPYVEKAERIYDHTFTEGDHRDLAGFLTGTGTHRWVLSYDRAPLVLDLYRNQPGVIEYDVDHTYTMRGTGRTTPVTGREVVFTNLTL